MRSFVPIDVEQVGALDQSRFAHRADYDSLKDHNACRRK